jgi:hypothetical protein
VAALWILSVLAAFGLARLTGTGQGPSDLGDSGSFQRALQDVDPLTRSYRFSAFLQDLGPEELSETLELLDTHQIGVTREEVRLLMLAWTRFDAPAAFAWARDWPTEWRTLLMSEAMWAWGFRDAPAALAALDGVEDDELQTSLRQSLLEAWVASEDKAAAGAYVASLSDARMRRRLTFLLAGESMRKGAPEVLRWAESVPEDAPNRFKESAFYQAANVVARTEPRTAALWYEKHRQQPYSKGAVNVIARKWAAHNDPPGLFAWLRSLPDGGEHGAERNEALAVGFRLWLRSAPEEAEAWLQASLPDPWLDPAIAELVRARAQRSAPSAMEWAARIENEQTRRGSSLLAGRMWRRQDPEALNAWLADSDLPEDVQQSILQGPPPVARGRVMVRPGESAAQ